jgi:hypothetical protein
MLYQVHSGSAVERQRTYLPSAFEVVNTNPSRYSTSRSTMSQQIHYKDKHVYQQWQIKRKPSGRAVDGKSAHHVYRIELFAFFQARQQIQNNIISSKISKTIIQETTYVFTGCIAFLIVSATASSLIQRGTMMPNRDFGPSKFGYSPALAFSRVGPLVPLPHHITSRSSMTYKRNTVLNSIHLDRSDFVNWIIHPERDTRKTADFILERDSPVTQHIPSLPFTIFAASSRVHPLHSVRIPQSRRWLSSSITEDHDMIPQGATPQWKKILNKMKDGTAHGNVDNGPKMLTILAWFSYIRNPSGSFARSETPIWTVGEVALQLSGPMKYRLPIEIIARPLLLACAYFICRFLCITTFIYT